jgi:hypothetical protein
MSDKTARHAVELLLAEKRAKPRVAWKEFSIARRFSTLSVVEPLI